MGVGFQELFAAVLALRSRLTKILNIPQGYASGFVSSAASLDNHCEHPVGDLELMKHRFQKPFGVDGGHAS